MSAKNEVRLLALSEEGKENLDVACKLLNERMIKTLWVSSQDALTVSKFEDDIIYIVDPTQGEEVDHLVATGFSVIGPQCAMTVLKHDIQLKRNLKYPIYNLTMLECLICFSNIPPQQRQELITKVECMGGKTSASLTQDVTHLVVKEVGSVKYFSAAHVGIPIMTVNWINHLWMQGSSRYISAKDGKWQDFRCPIFLGCSVCVTGFSTKERSKIQKLVTKFGGMYSGAMKLDFTTHLIVHKPEGQKYEMASKFGVKVVSVDWVYMSVEKGSCQDHSRYPVKILSKNAHTSSPHSSTPEKGADAIASVPAIQDMSNISVVTVNETMGTSVSDISRLSTIPPPSSQIRRNDKKDLMDFSFDQLYDLVLDGICVFVVGFGNEEEDKKLKQILSISGAVQYSQLMTRVTHVIIGSALIISKAVVTVIRAAMDDSNRELCVVGYKWLIDCLNKGEILPEINYSVTGFEPKTPIVKEFISDAVTDHRQSISLHKEVKNPSDISDDYTLNVLAQYMEGDFTVENVNTEDTTVKNVTMRETKGKDENNPPLEYDDENVTACDGAIDESSAWFLFMGKSFLLRDFDIDDEERCAENIRSMKGQVLSSSTSNVDYIVVPITCALPMQNAKYVVTNFWVDFCMHNGSVMDLLSHPMCTPFNVTGEQKPLEGSVGCISQYQEPERSHLINLIQTLGGIYQDNLVRRDMPNERLCRTTHLIVMKPEGDKYLGSKKWGIHTVSAEWVYECACKGVKATELNFDVMKLNTSTNDKSTSVKEASNTKSDGTTLDFLPMPRGPSAVDAIKRRLEARDESMRAKKQKMETPMQERFRRLNVETPSKFISKGSNLNISFQLEEVFALLKTPIQDREKVKEELRRNPDTPLSEFVERFLADSLKEQPDMAEVVANLERVFEKIDSNNDETKEMEDDGDVVEVDKESVEVVGPEMKPLYGTVIYACKKLNKRRMSLSSLVTELGGDFRWLYDASCTHVIFQGKQSDTNKEFRTAKSDGKIIVSPHWVTACNEVRKRVSEGEYPHVYDPNKSMNIIPVQSHYTARRNTSKFSKLELSQSKSPAVKTRNNPSLPPPPDSQVVSQSDNTEKDGASQEARESLRKTLENIMSSTTKIKTGSSLPSNGRGRFSSPAHLIPHETSIPVKNNGNKGESSQDVHVEWDDPIRRGEMERLLKEVDKKSDTTTCNDDDAEKDNNDAETRNIDHLSYVVQKGGQPVFLVSSVTPEQKKEYASIIETLGGIYLDSDCFDSSCTHLIVKKPARNEKFLASLSSGKWVMHTSYIDACKGVGVFLKEDSFEYGNPASNWKPTNETEALLVASAHRWRCLLGGDSETTGAFERWNVILHVSDRHKPGFLRLLQSGAGLVVSNSLPYNGQLEGVTHAIIDPSRAKQLPIGEIKRLVDNDIHCCLPEYIADFLMKDPPPSPETLYLPLVKNMLKS